MRVRLSAGWPEVEMAVMWAALPRSGPCARLGDHKMGGVMHPTSIFAQTPRLVPGLLGPVHSYETSLPSLTTSLIINCISARLNCNGTFQCRSINESANPRSRSSDESGRGRAARGVSSWLWFRGLCFSVAAWCKEAPDGGSFSCFSRESPPRARRDRRPDLCDGFCRSAGLRPPEFHFGQFRVSRVAAVGWSSKKKVRFLLRCASA